jgi:polyisoprenoid-binding protein YceI
MTTTKSALENARTTMIIASMIGLAFAGPAAAQSAGDATVVEVRGGTAVFVVDTNISAISVHGRSNALTARLRLRQTTDGAVLEGIEAAMSVKTLATGMELRDEHMRKYIFTTGDGQLPDLRFSAERAVCSKAVSRQSTCELSGNLAIRGTMRPFTVVLKVSEHGDTFRVVGDGTVMLSAYGIERPSQLGVKTADDVKLRFDLTAKQTGPHGVATTGTAR